MMLFTVNQPYRVALVALLSTIVVIGGSATATDLPWTPPTCIGDGNEDGIVNVADLLDMFNAWGDCPDGGPEICPLDLNGDGQIDVSDLVILFNSWGPCPDDVAVIHMSYPTPVVSFTNVPVTVALKNYGPETVMNTVTVCIGPGNGHCGTVNYELQPYAVKEVVATVVAPNSTVPCGGVNPMSINACSNYSDANNGNNCMTDTIGVVGQYWDLSFQLIGAPNSAPIYPCNCLPHLVNWTVRVTNVGNITYTGDSACLITAIVPTSGPGNFNTPVDGWRFFAINGPIEPGEHRNYTVNGYRILCGAIPGTQWVKAEINYNPGGCNDPCGTGSGNNFVQQPINLSFASCNQP